MNTLLLEKPAAGDRRRGGPVVRRTFVVNLEHGLHARPCAALVKALRPFESQVEVKANGELASGHSVMGLMILAAGWGSKITFTISGKDAHQTMAAVDHLFDTNFEEAYAQPPAAATT